VTSTIRKHTVTGHWRCQPVPAGQLQGANASLTSVTGLLGPGLFATAFSMLPRPLPGAAFDLAALILPLAPAVAWWATRTPAADRPR
jgi:DHA1 family tetracycline resistance protein-like MFS transporter